MVLVALLVAAPEAEEEAVGAAAAAVDVVVAASSCASERHASSTEFDGQDMRYAPLCTMDMRLSGAAGGGRRITRLAAAATRGQVAEEAHFATPRSRLDFRPPKQNKKCTLASSEEGTRTDSASGATRRNGCAHDVTWCKIRGVSKAILI